MAVAVAGRRKRAPSPLSVLSDLNQSIFRNYHDFPLGRTREAAEMNL